MLDILVQSRRNRRAAVRFFRKLLKRQGCVPRRLSLHVLQGTLRPNDRHASMVATAPMVASDEISPKTAARIGRGLGQSGRRLVQRILKENEGWTVIDLELLRRAGRSLDVIEKLDAAIADDVVVTGKRGARTVNGLIAAQRGEVRQWLALVRQLGLEHT